MSGAFNEINRERDIVLVDQRGTGELNPMVCDIPPGVAEENVSPLLKICLNRFDVDPALFTTSIAMTDLNEVRELLGYDQINIYGVSYGSRAALTYLRMFPDTVRTVILDGVAPPQIPLGLDMGADAQAALDLIFARCASDPECSERFPNLEEEFDTLMQLSGFVLARTNITHPITGQPITINMDPYMISSVVRFYSYSPETVALLPVLIHETVRTVDYSHFVTQALMLGNDLNATISAPMSYSVLCAEDVPFYTTSEASRASYLGTVISDELEEICSFWPANAIPRDFKAPVVSDVPVLLLSGEYDPVTPPKYADLAAETLSEQSSCCGAGGGAQRCDPRLCTKSQHRIYRDRDTRRGLKQIA